MIIVKKVNRLKKFVQSQKIKHKTIGFVPTMGALHEGHLSLMRKARKENDTVIVSIFVNPAQFGPKEDLAKYPRDIARDAKLCLREGVDAIFNPGVKEMYPQGYETFVTVEKLSGLLCGRSRPGHFKGVATIVLKLLNLVQPDTAYFGRKDAQQAQIIKRMVFDLNLPVSIKTMPIVREAGGLAMSSRNVYLHGRQRQDALVLSQSLKLARKMVSEGNRIPSTIINAMKQLIRRKKTARVDYIEIVDPDTFDPVKKITEKSLIVLAVWIGKTRLIDNAYA